MREFGIFLFHVIPVELLVWCSRILFCPPHFLTSETLLLSPTTSLNPRLPCFLRLWPLALLSFIAVSFRF
ncbi:hypothetical protein V6Z12_A03G240300 [Gossypium hirsutum]